MKISKFSIAALIAFALAASCIKEELTEPVRISTTEPQNVTSNTARIGGILNSALSEYPNAKVGVKFSTESNPVDGLSVFASNSDGKSFSCELSDLQQQTVYYYAAFVDVTGLGKESSTILGEINSFRTAAVKVEKVTLNISDTTLVEGQKTELIAEVFPEDSGDKSVTWSSSNAGVASVDANGTVTAKAPGSAVITVKTADGGKTASCSVTVKAKTVAVTGVTLDRQSLSLIEGETSKLSATVKPDNASNKSVTWSSSNAGVASVDANGTVTAKAPGSAVITVKTADGGKTASCSVTVTAKNVVKFEDNAFKEYCVQHFDTDGDGEISIEEALVVSYIYVVGLNISSLTGIESFTSLRYLVCYNNQLTSLDITKNTALTCLSCSDNQLTSLDVSKNTALTELYCGNNQLTSLDVSKNTALTELYCGNNQLTSLDVSNYTALTKLRCDNNQLTSLDVSNYTALTVLQCGNNQLTSLDVSKNTALTELRCDKNQLTSLDVSNNTALTVLDCFANELTSLDITKNTALTELHCVGNQISIIFVWQGFDHSKLTCYKDESVSFFLKNTNVEFDDANFKAYCVQHFDTDGDGEISIEEAIMVKSITVDGGAIKSLKGIEYFRKLNSLNCSPVFSSASYDDNGFHFYDSDHREIIGKITSLDVSKNKELRKLTCSYNSLSSLDLRNNPYLNYLDCDNNQIESIDLSNYSLMTLSCNNNHLTSLNISECINLNVLNCDSNKLTHIDLSNCAILRSLSCFNNQLTSLDVRNNTALTFLSCDDNQLTSLDISKNKFLEHLFCTGNSINSIFVWPGFVESDYPKFHKDFDAVYVVKE